MTTLKDISQRVNTSPSTISRLLNGDPTLSVSEAKRKEILSVVEQLGYRSPKRGKRAVLSQKDSGSAELPAAVQGQEVVVINFLSPSEEIGDPYFTSIRVGIQEQCFKRHLPLRSIHKLQISAHVSVIKQAAAIIAVGHYSAQEVEQMFSYNNNLIFVDSNPIGCRADSVILDRDAAAFEVMQHIIASGAKRPAFIGNAEERYHQFKAITQERGIFDQKFCDVSKEYCIESGYQAMQEMLNYPIIPDVVYAGTDMVAVGVYRAIYEKGLSIPEDITVIGFNDIASAQHMSPPLTTMRLFPFEMGKEAVNLYLEIVEGRKVKKTIYFGHEFIWRESFLKPQNAQ